MRWVFFTVVIWGCLSAIPCLVKVEGSETDGWSDQLELSGWGEAIQSMRFKSPNDSLTSRAKLRLELAADMDWLYPKLEVVILFSL